MAAENQDRISINGLLEQRESLRKELDDVHSKVIQKQKEKKMKIIVGIISSLILLGVGTLLKNSSWVALPGLLLFVIVIGLVQIIKSPGSAEEEKESHLHASLMELQGKLYEMQALTKAEEEDVEQLRAKEAASAIANSRQLVIVLLGLGVCAWFLFLLRYFVADEVSYLWGGSGIVLLAAAVVFSRRKLKIKHSPSALWDKKTR